MRVLSTVHEMIPVKECDTCACAKFRRESGVATTHAETIRTVQSLTTSSSKCFMFSVCIQLQSSVAPTSSSLVK